MFEQSPSSACKAPCRSMKFQQLLAGGYKAIAATKTVPNRASVEYNNFMVVRQNLEPWQHCLEQHKLE